VKYAALSRGTKLRTRHYTQFCNLHSYQIRDNPAVHKIFPWQRIALIKIKVSLQSAMVSSHSSTCNARFCTVGVTVRESKFEVAFCVRSCDPLTHLYTDPHTSCIVARIQGKLTT